MILNSFLSIWFTVVCVLTMTHHRWIRNSETTEKMRNRKYNSQNQTKRVIAGLNIGMTHIHASEVWMNGWTDGYRTDWLAGWELRALPISWKWWSCLCCLWPVFRRLRTNSAFGIFVVDSNFGFHLLYVCVCRWMDGWLDRRTDGRTRVNCVLIKCWYFYC